MPIRFKTGGGGAGNPYGGSWTAPIADGLIRTRWGGGWFVPTTIRHKVGDVGTGSWRDTGYRGYPGNPSAPWVHNWSSWGYSHMQIAWNYASGGAPAVSYDALQTDSAGNWLAAEWGGTDNITGFNTVENGYYQYLVRSVGSTGLVSPWQGPLKVYMGHSATPIPGYVHHADYWYSQIDGRWGKDEPFWIYVPNSVHMHNFHYNISTPMSGTLSPGTNRYISLITFGTDWGNTEHWPSPYSAVVSVGDQPGQDNYTGYVPRGAGWSTTGNSYYSVNGSFGIEGYNHYDTWEPAGGGWNPATGNGYW